MADDKFNDSRDESNESTPLDPTGAELADPDLPEAAGQLTETPGELTEQGEILDPRDTADDSYVDDPATTDINEAKLDRATDEVSDDDSDAGPDDAGAEDRGTAAAGARRRPRAGRPVRREEPAAGESTDAEPTGFQSAGESERGSTGRTRTTAPVRKDHATRSRKEAEAAPKRTSERTTPAKFVVESIGELRKVVWPTGNQVQQYFVVVLVFVLFIMTFVSLLDLGFGWVILKVFG